MIKQNEQFFQLDTANTTYAFKVLPTGQLEHLYYGRKVRIDDPCLLEEKHAFAPGNTNTYNAEVCNYSLEDMCLEMSGYGKGDIREPFIEVVAADGSNTTDFVYESATITKGKEEFETLPGSYDETNEVEHLTVVLKDKNQGYTLELHYYVYEDKDVITRSAKFINTSDAKVDLKRLMSLQLDLADSDYVVTSFHGGWTNEMNKKEMTLNGGRFVNSSFTGSSSSRSNPFTFLRKADTTEWYGDCYGLNIIYSGNHYSAFEVNSFAKTRAVVGINPQNFSFAIEAGESFEAPEAVMTYSCAGMNGMSQNLHAFVREHIVRGTWKKKARPVLLNSWEAAYFDINESKLLKLAEAGKEVGCELFVMDDGWFGTRDDDKQALGDWDYNPKKLPHGVKGLAEKVNKLGLDFGIWVEPEMVNVNSDLYRAHPDWAMAIPDKDHSEGRNQRILDFANPEVVDYMTEKMTEVFSSGNISYVKWDMNRTFTDIYSPYLPAEKQQECAHRYIVGVYKMMKTLNERFPDILFEGCAAGGNRFDLGILCYFPQIWGSDNTDSVCRLSIQNSYSYGYPLSTVSAHVSACPNHQTLRVTPLETRFAVASFGVLGYECNLVDMKKEDLEAIKVQIELYKQLRDTMQFGTFYRGRSENIYEWNVVAPDKSQAVGMVMQKLMRPADAYQTFKAVGLKEDAKYRFYGRKLKYNVKEFGDLVNAVTPIHIKQDGVLHNILAKFVRMDGELEEFEAYGDSLMYAGVKLKQGFVGTGYSDAVRHFPDFGARMYFMDEIK